MSAKSVDSGPASWLAYTTAHWAPSSTHLWPCCRSIQFLHRWWWNKQNKQKQTTSRIITQVLGIASPALYHRAVPISRLSPYKWYRLRTDCWISFQLVAPTILIVFFVFTGWCFDKATTKTCQLSLGLMGGCPGLCTTSSRLFWWMLHSKGLYAVG